jgi:hypothetical protein
MAVSDKSDLLKAIHELRLPRLDVLLAIVAR